MSWNIIIILILNVWENAGYTCGILSLGPAQVQVLIWNNVEFDADSEELFTIRSIYYLQSFDSDFHRLWMTWHGWIGTSIQHQKNHLVKLCGIHRKGKVKREETLHSWTKFHRYLMLFSGRLMVFVKHTVLWGRVLTGVNWYRSMAVSVRLIPAKYLILIIFWGGAKKSVWLFSPHRTQLFRFCVVEELPKCIFILEK